MFKPSFPYNVPMWVFIPQYVTAKGSTKKVLPKTGELIYCGFKTYGGTENTSNGILTVEDTAIIETYFRPDITSACEVRTENGARYEIISEPENIDMRNRYLKFKVRRVKGGA